MNQIQKINTVQLFLLMILQQIGTTTLFAIGIDAKQDAWMVILLSMLNGFLLMWLYTSIHQQYPDQSLTEIFQTVLGKWLAIPFISLYALYFFYTASFNLYESSELLILFFLQDTPLIALLLTTVLLVIMGITLGVEVIGRSAQIISPYYIFFLVAIFLFTVASGKADMYNLTPILENGMAPVFKAMPFVTFFPFGEAIVFLMYFHMVNDKGKVQKTAFFTIGFTGIVVTISTMVIIMVLGVEMAARQSVPLFPVIRKINIGDFIQRLDAVGGAVLFIGGFYKMTIFFNATVFAVNSLFKIKRQYISIGLLSIAWIVFVKLFFINFTFYKEVGSNINQYLLYPFQILIPGFLLLIIIIKKKSQKSS